MKSEGKFIVIYGTNNLGKSKQVELLCEALRTAGHSVISLKYPIYDLSPSGLIINDFLRNNSLKYGVGKDKIQEAYAMNRRQYEPTLTEQLKQGITIIAEDYTGTGIAWGMGYGQSQAELEELNKDLLIEDLAILLDGERFMQGVESRHTHEQDNDLTSKVRQNHLKLAKDYNWKIINANQSIEEVHKDIMQLVLPCLKQD